MLDCYRFIDRDQGVYSIYCERDIREPTSSCCHRTIHTVEKKLDRARVTQEALERARSIYFVRCNVEYGRGQRTFFIRNKSVRHRPVVLFEETNWKSGFYARERQSEPVTSTEKRRRPDSFIGVHNRSCGSRTKLQKRRAQDDVTQPSAARLGAAAPANVQLSKTAYLAPQQRTPRRRRLTRAPCRGGGLRRRLATTARLGNASKKTQLGACRFRYLVTFIR
ncbi:hypothetical protein EVAR_40949_1 [Eumeta japonica]|uniref:Uncharacterized protein n=1 Tax=Eumeta variegata TaxID=151549 RepID=A0A4C1X5F3_EUMVA|nr:hypothetical protein EVAR_40949_1 [Eumeta japonica]